MAQVEEKGSADGRDDYTQDGTVNLKGGPILRSKTGRWRACSFIVGNLQQTLLFCFAFSFAQLLLACTPASSPFKNTSNEFSLRRYPLQENQTKKKLVFERININKSLVEYHITCSKIITSQNALTSRNYLIQNPTSGFVL